MRLPAIERRLVTRLFNSTAAPYPRDRLIHQLFEEQVARTPHVEAVVCQDKVLTYMQLNESANRLAHYLRSLGVGPDDRVGIHIERGVDMVVGLLGILKAGGAYVPLDPRYPSERLQYILQDAAPKVVLSQRRPEACLDTTADVVALDGDWRAIARHNSHNLDAATAGLRPHHLAYVIHTSGSTGRPKGVMVTHQSVVNFLTSMREYPGITSTDCCLAVTTISFDIAALELYLPLLNGAKVVLARREHAADASLLMSLLEQHPVSILQATPATWKLLLSADWQGRKGLKALCGGEALTAALSTQIRSRVATLWNLYGPTETTIWSCIHEIPGTPESSSSVESVGRPIANTQIYILDQDRHPIAVGTPGEIYIGGAGVARGYLNRPELTAERFLPDPFSPDPNARIYRTGDLGRWRADGTIEYLGRNDQQVKIRGFRVELGEIEAWLAQHAQVAEAVVTAREDATGDQRLVAHVVGNSRTAVTSPSNGASGPLHGSMVQEWKTLWTATYETQQPAVGPSFAGWNSSYTGQPIPEPEMQEWLDCTVTRLLALQPRRVLEVGCGVGLLLQHLAPRCDTYVGTDLSSAAISRLKSWIQGQHGLAHVKLLECGATDLQDIRGGPFDTVILNSVVQYFPGPEYLLSVLQQAARLLEPGGRIFVGDIRHLGLLKTFHGAVLLHKTPATVTVEQLRKRLARAVALERELAIEPRFFQALPGYLSGINSVDVQLRRGHTENELTRYRYDVTLHVGNDPAPQIDYELLDWQTTLGSPAGLELCLQQHRWSTARVTSIPNLRLAKDWTAQRLLETSDARSEAGALRRQLQELPSEGFDPELFWKLGAACGYEVKVTWGVPSPHHFEVTFEDHNSVHLIRKVRLPREAIPVPGILLETKPPIAYTNNPQETSFRQQLIPQLRSYLKERLPEYMIPSIWVSVDRLPLTQNGKIDRRALPEPADRPEEAGEYLPPSTSTEYALAALWSQILGVDQVSVKDNFFELGAHSLHAMRLVARIRQQLGADLSLTEVLQSPTIEQLATLLDSRQATARTSDSAEDSEYEEGVI